ncbi:alpha/beta fold hydrolase [Mesorhizobium koreense]|uniref:alpha/beta fold hydrolase n=1 Tax=Mesorhizobium koreense TaxID=3074855 RepID=UPI00287B7195|nr:alpha/beta hydrolase [Mesorhizobium sp. WR6]
MASRTGAPEGTMFKANGLEWDVIDTGMPSPDAPTLVLLPGTLGTAGIFRAQIDGLRDIARVIALTYPIERNLGRLVDSLITLLDELGIDTFHILGSSFGGFAAQWLADRASDRIETLFIGNSLVDPVPSRKRLPPLDTMEAMNGEQHKELILKSVAGWDESEPVFADLKKKLMESAETVGGEGLKARVMALQNSQAVPPLAVAPERIVIIESVDDPLIGPEARRAVEERYPGAEIRRFRVGGHYPYVTRPDEYNAIIRERLLAAP